MMNTVENLKELSAYIEEENFEGVLKYIEEANEVNNEEIRKDKSGIYDIYIEIAQEHYTYLSMDLKNIIFKKESKRNTFEDSRKKIENKIQDIKNDIENNIKLSGLDVINYRLDIVECMILCKMGFLDDAREKYVELKKDEENQTLATYVAFAMICTKIIDYDNLECLLEKIINKSYVDNRFYSDNKIKRNLEHTLAFIVGFLYLKKNEFLISKTKEIDSFVKDNGLDIDVESIIRR